MNLTIKRDELVAAASAATTATPSKTTVPAFANVTIEATTHGVSFTGTDGIHAVRSPTPAVVTAPGRVAVRAKDFISLIKSLTGATIALEVVRGALDIRSGKSRYKLPLAPIDDEWQFPEAEQDKYVDAVPAPILRSALDGALYAASQAAERPQLCVVRLEFGAKHVVAVSTDGLRLAKASFAREAPRQDASFDFQLPRHSAEALRSLLQKCADDDILEIAYDGTRVSVGAEHFDFGSRVADGDFPHYVNVIPKDRGDEVDVSIATLRAALNRAALLAEGARRGTLVMSLTQDGDYTSMRVTASSDDGANGVEDIDIEARPAEGALTKAQFGLRVSFVDEALAALERMGAERATIVFIRPLDPILIRDPNNRDFVAVIMPVRL